MAIAVTDATGTLVEVSDEDLEDAFRWDSGVLDRWCDSFTGVAVFRAGIELVLVPTEDKRFVVTWFDASHQQWVFLEGSNVGVSCGFPGGEQMCVAAQAALNGSELAALLIALQHADGQLQNAVDLLGFRHAPIEQVLVFDHS